MELRELTTFRTVAHTLSFTQTAALLGYAQSSITAQIQSLESEFGVPLFNRMGRKISLTDAGTRLLWYADKILDLANEALANVNQGTSTEITGTLTIGAPESICTYCLPAVLGEFRKRAPRVRLIFKPLPYAELHHSIREGKIDIAFLLEAPIQSTMLHIETLCVEPMVLIANPDHPLAQKPGVEPSDLEGETLLLTERGCGYRGIFESLLSSAGVRPAISIEFDSVEAIKQCVIAGLGIAVLPHMTIEANANRGELQILRWTKPFDVFTQMVWHKDRWLSPPLQAFLETSRGLPHLSRIHLT